VIPLLAVAAAGLVLGALFYYPLAAVLLASLRIPTESDTNFLWSVARFTYTQAFLSALLSAALGMPGAVLFSQSRGRFRQLWAALSLVPFSLPPILVVLGLLGVWGRQGPLAGWLGEDYDGIYGWVGILLAHTLFNFPLFVQLVGQALQVGDRAEEKAGLALGLSRVRCFAWITWPKIRGAFVSAFVLAFLFSASSFLVVLILGGGPAFTSIEVAIFQAIKQDFDPGLAVRLAGLQMLVATALSFWMYRSAPVSSRSHQIEVGIYRFRRIGLQRGAESVYGLALVLLVGLPLLWVLGKGAGQWFRVDELPRALGVSLRLAVSAAVLSTVLAFVLEYGAHQGRLVVVRALVSLACTLPLAVSSLLVLLGWRLAYPGWLESSAGVWWAVAWVQALVALPVVYRPLKEAFSRVPPEWEKMARTLGASRWQHFAWVLWPALRRGVLLALLLGALVALGEAGAVLLFQDESTMNLTYLIYQNMGRYRFDQAYGLAAALMVLAASICLVVAYLEREPAK
jgi:thiamine transport system permease protein